MEKDAALPLQSTSGGLSAPLVAPSQDGRLELFAVGADYSLYHRWQFADLSWSDWVSHGNAGAGGGYLYVSLGVPFMTLIQLPSGTLDLIAWNNLDEDLYRIHQVIPSNGWSGWQHLAANPATPHQLDVERTSSPPVAAIDGAGNLHLFISAPYTRSYDTIYQGTLTPAGDWLGWTQFSTPPGNFVVWPMAAANPDGRLELFGIGSGGNLWHTWQTSVGGPWVPWYSQNWPGVPLRGDPYPTIVANADGRLEVFLAGDDGALYHLPQAIVNANWGAWESFGPPPGTQLTGENAIALGWSADGRRELFVVADDHQLWHLWQTDLNGTWSSWYSHGVPPGTELWGGVAVYLNTDNCQELFVDASDGNIYSLKQVAPNSGWSDWIDFGQP